MLNRSSGQLLGTITRLLNATAPPCRSSCMWLKPIVLLARAGIQQGRQSVVEHPASGRSSHGWPCRPLRASSARPGPRSTGSPSRPRSRTAPNGSGKPAHRCSTGSSGSASQSASAMASRRSRQVQTKSGVAFWRSSWRKFLFLSFHSATEFVECDHTESRLLKQCQSARWWRPLLSHSVGCSLFS